MMDLLNLGSGLVLVASGCVGLAALAFRSALLRRRALAQQLSGFNLPMPALVAFPSRQAEAPSARVANQRLRGLLVRPMPVAS